MTSEAVRSDESLPYPIIEQACQRFHEAWNRGEHPDLQEYLVGMNDAARRFALCDMLLIEWEHRRRLGAPAELEEYRKRFADFVEIVDEAWRSDFGRKAAEAEVPQVRGGRYKLIKSHARGGFGQVYVAEDAELGRHVAVKEMQLRHSQNQATQERFIREAKITGKLEHPGIVPVYSVGTNADGTPYYAMRFVQGESLQSEIAAFHLQHRSAPKKDLPAEPTLVKSTPHSGEHGADTQSSAPSHGGRAQSQRASRTVIPLPRDAFRSRDFRRLLAQFVYVCKVIQYAHSRGVLHRDLKPANIILGKHGETLVVDWGLARDTSEPEVVVTGSDRERRVSPSLTHLSYTTQGALIGTPSYMSPEQAAGKLGELTVASDIYSLGATFYHLLVGTAPLSGVSHEELLQRVQRGEIPDARQLQPSCPAALNAICARAMSLDPQDRYETADMLADDLEHWLADETVEAYVEPFRERAGRWARRHQTATVAGIVALLLTTVASIGIAVLVTISNRRLDTARTEAVQKGLAAVSAQNLAEAARLSAESAQKDAERERDLSKYIADFMVQCFRSPDPEIDGRTITVAELLDQAYESLKRDASLNPQTKVNLFVSLAHSYLGLGLYDDAVSVAGRGSDHASEHLGIDSDEYLRVQELLGMAYLEQGAIQRGLEIIQTVVNKTVALEGENSIRTLSRKRELAYAYTEAGLVNDALEVMNAVRPTLNELVREDELEVARTDAVMAHTLVSNGMHSSAVTYFEKVLALYQNRLGNLHPRTIEAQNSLARTYELDGRYSDARNIYDSFVQNATDILGPDHPTTLTAQGNLAWLYTVQGDYKQSLSLMEQVLERRKTVLGETHPLTLSSRHNIAVTMDRMGRTREAAELLKDVVAKRIAHLGVGHPDTLRAKSSLAAVLIRSGVVDDAIVLLEDLVPTIENKMGNAHPDFLSAKLALAFGYRQRGLNVNAIEAYRALLPIAFKVFGPNHQRYLNIENNLATALAMSNRYSEASELYEGISKKFAAAVGIDHPDTLQVRLNQAICLQNMSEHEASLRILRPVAEAAVDSLTWEHPITGQAHFGLGASLKALGRNSEARSVYETILSECEKTLGDRHLQTITAKRYFAGFLLLEDEGERAVKLFRQSAEALREVMGPNNLESVESVRELASALRDIGEFGEAESIFRTLVDQSRSEKKQDPLTIAAYMYWVGICQLEQGKVIDAEHALSECLQSRRTYAPNDWTVPVTVSALGMCQLKQSKFGEAEQSLFRSYEELQTLRDVIPRQQLERTLKEAGDRISEWYRDTNQPDKLARWLQILE